MAQVKPFNWYGNEDAPAFAGLKADTSVDVCDSFCSEGGVNPGDAVIRGTDKSSQCKAVTATTDAASVLGIAVHVHREPQETSSDSYYEEGYNLSVMTFGDIYVEAGGDVVAGTGVGLAIDGTTKAITYITAATSNTIDGATFLDSGAKGDIVRVRIRK